MPSKPCLQCNIMSVYLDNRQVKDLSGLPNLWIVPIFCYNVGGEGIIRHFFSFPSFQKLHNL